MAIGSEAVMAVALFASIASLAWSAAYAWGKWLARPQPPGQLTGEAAGRLARLEQAVDAIAVEVERIGEAQRFTTRLLQDSLSAPQRAALAPGAERGEHVTPH